MITFQDKIFYLKNLIPEDGLGEVLQRLKMMLAHNAQRLNDIIQFETRLSRLNKDYNFQFLTKEEYERGLSLLTKSLMDFLDELTPADLEVQVAKQETRVKKNQGHLLQHIPSQMQLFKRTKCTLRLAFLEEDLLENFKMTEDTVIKSIRVAEVMEVELQDRNEEPAFEITTPNNKEQFIDEDYYTEWIFYVKPIRGGEHQLTLVVSVLEEVRGKERRRDVVLEEIVTIVADEPVLDTVYKSTGYATNSTQTVEPQAFTGFMQSLRKYSAVAALLVVSTMATWAFNTEKGQWLIAKILNTEASYERFIKKYENKKESKLLEQARWEKALRLDTEQGYEEYLAETETKTFEQLALAKLENKVFQRVMKEAKRHHTEPLEEYIKRFPKSNRLSIVFDKLIALEYECVSENIDKGNIEELIAFRNNYKDVNTKLNASIQTKAKIKYEAIIKQNKNDNKTKTKKTSSKAKTEAFNEILTEKNTIKKQPSDPFVENMVLIRGGSFSMGSNEYDEKPIHTVTVSSFYISKYEVTQKQWRDIMGNNPSYFKNCDDCPVEQVSWNDIQEFLKKINTQTGKNYRLPTEAEWEYAAKCGQNHKYAGSDNIDNVAWYGDEKANKKTHPVGQKSPNGYGLYDMSGNVWEWCSDWYSSSYYKNSPSNNPQGRGIGAFRVLRGGSWNDYADDCRSAFRSNYAPNYRYNINGFRLAL